MRGIGMCALLDLFLEKVMKEVEGSSAAASTRRGLGGGCANESSECTYVHEIPGSQANLRS